MSLYLFFFKEAFNSVPNCAGCSFSSDWQKLVSFYSVKKEKSVTLQKSKNMKTITIKKIQGKILSYKKDGKTYRLYDNILTDDFIKEYVSNGTEEEIKERKKMFNFPVEEIELNLQNKEWETAILKSNAEIILDEPSGIIEYTIEESEGLEKALEQIIQPKKRGRKPKK